MKDKWIDFRLKCEPRIKVTAPAELVKPDNDGFVITFWNENSCLQTIVMLDKYWEKEEVE